MATESEEAHTSGSDRHLRVSYVTTPMGKKIEIVHLTDDDDDEIDWEEIIRTTQDDYEAGRYSFNSEDYATHEEAMVAMEALIDSIAEEVEREIEAERKSAARPPLDATR